MLEQKKKTSNIPSLIFSFINIFLVTAAQWNTVKLYKPNTLRNIFLHLLFCEILQCTDAPTMDVGWLLPKFFTANIIFGIYLRYIYVRLEIQSFL